MSTSINNATARSKIRHILKRLAGCNPRVRAIAWRIGHVLGFLPLNSAYHSKPLSGKKVRIIGARPLGVNLSGYLTSEFGLAEAARGMAHALEAAQVPFVLNNLTAENHRSEDKSLTGFRADNPYPINLIAITDLAIPHLHAVKGRRYFKRKYNIGILYWELSRFPEDRWSNLDFYNEIWVTSAFCAEAIGKAARIPVVKMTHSLFIDETQVKANRPRFGLPEDTFVFLTYFDFQSVFERKNPLGGIEAFRIAFADCKDATLVIKSIGAHLYPETLELLVEAARGLNVRFMHEHFNRSDMLSLLKSADCFVSLHRSEGLGLGMAEAMYLEKPVIATAYSGNMDFMNINNSLLVKYQLVELGQDYGPYAKGNVWAEPDYAHAAELMLSVYNQRVMATQLGCRAAQDIKAYMNPLASGQEMRNRLLRITTV